jgi:hypothetical protein
METRAKSNMHAQEAAQLCSGFDIKHFGHELKQLGWCGLSRAIQDRTGY